MALTLSIEGADKTALFQVGSFNVSDDLNSRNACSFRLVDPAGAYRPNVGQEVLIQHDGATVFAGTIDTIQETEIPGTNALEFAVSCVDYNQLTDRHLVAAVYENELLGDIVKAITASDLAGEDITTAHVQDGPMITKIVCNYQTVAEVFNALAELTGYAWNIDYTKDLHFFARETYTAPIAITDSSNNFRNLKVTKTRDQYRNRQYVRAGHDITDSRTETFKGDGELKTFSLVFPVALVPSAVTVNGAPKTIGIRGVETGRAWYWSKGEREITQDDGAAALTAADTLSVTYRGMFPILLSAQDDAEITDRISVEGGSGIYDAIEDDQNIDSQDLAIGKADALLRRFGHIPQIIKFETDEDGLASGQLISINLAAHGLAGQYLIDSVAASDMDTFLRYQVQCLDGESLGGWVDFFRKLAAAGRQFVIRENEVLILLRRTSDTVTLTDILETEENPLHGFRVEMDTLIFSRPSLAYHRVTGAEVESGIPRYEDGPWAGHLAALVEKGTTPLLTVNQASIETDTTGFSSTRATIARSAVRAWHGTYSLGITATDANPVAYIDYPISVAAGTPFSFSARGWGITGKRLQMRIGFLGGVNPGSGVNTFYDYNGEDPLSMAVSGAVDYADRTSLRLYVYAPDHAAGEKYYIDGLHLEQNAYPTSFQLPGVARANELLTVPLAGLSPAAWTWEQWVYVDAMAKRQIAGQFPGLFTIPRANAPTARGIGVYHRDSTAEWTLGTRNDANQATTVNFSDACTPDGWHLIKAAGDATIAQVFVDNIPQATINNPNLPSAFHTLGYVGYNSTEGHYAGALHADIRISNINRSGETADLTKPLEVDENTIGRALLNGDLTFEPHYPVRVGFCEVIA